MSSEGSHGSSIPFPKFYSCVITTRSKDFTIGAKAQAFHPICMPREGFSRGEQQKALSMAQATLRLDKTLADVEVLKQTLWGTKLIAKGEKLLSHPNIQALRVKK